MLTVAFLEHGQFLPTYNGERWVFKDTLSILLLLVGGQGLGWKDGIQDKGGFLEMYGESVG